MAEKRIDNVYPIFYIEIEESYPLALVLCKLELFYLFLSIFYLILNAWKCKRYILPFSIDRKISKQCNANLYHTQYILIKCIECHKQPWWKIYLEANVCIL